MTDTRIPASLIAVLATAVMASAQAGQSSSQPQTPASTAQAPAVTVQPTVTVVGCLYREEQVPGRTPNIAERAGILEDYILADASLANAQSSANSSTPGATGTSGTMPTTGNMYKVEKIPGDRLKAMVGKRVEVVGRIDPEGSPARPAGAQPDRGLGPDKINLPEIEGASIREASGTCPATPAPLK